MVRSKAYTLNRLIAEVQGLNGRRVTTFAALATNLSPRAGASSVKIKVLNTFLNGNLRSVANASEYGATVKARVLKALRARKRYGSF